MLKRAREKYMVKNEMADVGERGKSGIRKVEISFEYYYLLTRKIYLKEWYTCSTHEGGEYVYKCRIIVVCLCLVVSGKKYHTRDVIRCRVITLLDVILLYDI